MEKSNRFYFTLAGALLLSATLVGCGGGTDASATGGGGNTAISPSEVADATKNFTESTVDPTPDVVEMMLDDAGTALAFSNTGASFTSKSVSQSPLLKEIFQGKNVFGSKALDNFAQAISINLGIARPNNINQTGLGELTQSSLVSLQTTSQDAGCTSGEGTIDIDAEVAQGNNGDITGEFDECDLGDGSIVDGMVVLTVENEGVTFDEGTGDFIFDDEVISTLTTSFTDFATTENGNTCTLNGSVTASSAAAVDETAGTIAAGQGYSIENLTGTGNCDFDDTSTTDEIDIPSLETSITAEGNLDEDAAFGIGLDCVDLVVQAVFEAAAFSFPGVTSEAISIALQNIFNDASCAAAASVFAFFGSNDNTVACEPPDADNAGLNFLGTDGDSTTDDLNLTGLDCDSGAATFEGADGETLECPEGIDAAVLEGAFNQV